MWLDKAHSERFLWFSIVVVKNLKLDLSLGQFNVEQGKQHILLLLLLLLPIEGRPKHILRYVIITFIHSCYVMSSLFQICNSLTFMLSWF